MMNRPDDMKGKKQQQWQERIAQERLNLSASVEEALVDTSTNEDIDADELENAVPFLENTPLIAPRLSLQSKQLPAISTSVKVRTDHLPTTKTGQAVSSSLESFNTATVKQRPSRRTTKVRLQVVPKAET